MLTEEVFSYFSILNSMRLLGRSSSRAAASIIRELA